MTYPSSQLLSSSSFDLSFLSVIFERANISSDFKKIVASLHSKVTMSFKMDFFSKLFCSMLSCLVCSTGVISGSFFYKQKTKHVPSILGGGQTVVVTRAYKSNSDFDQRNIT